MASSEEITTLTFTPDNPCNTVVTSSAGKVLYRVTTDAAAKSPVTHVYDGADELVASLEWHSVSADKVILKGQPPVSFTDWMKKSHIPFKDEASFKDAQGRKYKWKGIGPGRCMELHSEDDSFKTVIARYTRSYRMPNPAGDDPLVIHTPGELKLTPRAAEVQELVVLTLLFQEKRRRLEAGGLSEGAGYGLAYGSAVGGAFGGLA
ncbi:hypothetical protein PsYK624_106840 [Phanerochaete sordida]|uniref:DUF6593 domain-containing protein n=1 Tax=Phanerochaete sordida TaxID=48140 RepID=A0A9P3GHQ6_9APHY|nr:hypothetical protein PsYK624_106840 [Phanerochaete sordida]